MEGGDKFVQDTGGNDEQMPLTGMQPEPLTMMKSSPSATTELISAEENEQDMKNQAAIKIQTMARGRHARTELLELKHKRLINFVHDSLSAAKFNKRESHEFVSLLKKLDLEDEQDLLYVQPEDLKSAVLNPIRARRVLSVVHEKVLKKCGGEIQIPRSILNSPSARLRTKAFAGQVDITVVNRSVASKTDSIPDTTVAIAPSSGPVSGSTIAPLISEETNSPAKETLGTEKRSSSAAELCCLRRSTQEGASKHHRASFSSFSLRKDKRIASVNDPEESRRLKNSRQRELMKKRRSTKVKLTPMQRARIMIAMRNHFQATKLVLRRSAKQRFRAAVYGVTAVYRFRMLSIAASGGNITTRYQVARRSIPNKDTLKEGMAFQTIVKQAKSEIDKQRVEWESQKELVSKLFTKHTESNSGEMSDVTFREEFPKFLKELEETSKHKLSCFRYEMTCQPGPADQKSGHKNSSIRPFKHLKQVANLVKTSGSKGRRDPTGRAQAGDVWEEAFNSMRGKERTVTAAAVAKHFPVPYRFLDLKNLGLTSQALSEIMDSIEAAQPHGLDLSFNKMCALPKNICRLGSVKQLVVNWNRLESLPSQLCSLKNLDSLYLAGNNLKELPSNIGKLPLRSLCCEKNNIRTLPASIMDWKDLCELDLDSNPIELDDTACKHFVGLMENSAMSLHYVRGVKCETLRGRMMISCQLCESQAKGLLPGQEIVHDGSVSGTPVLAFNNYREDNSDQDDQEHETVALKVLLDFGCDTANSIARECAQLDWSKMCAKKQGRVDAKPWQIPGNNDRNWDTPSFKARIIQCCIIKGEDQEGYIEDNEFIGLMRRSFVSLEEKQQHKFIKEAPAAAIAALLLACCEEATYSQGDLGDEYVFNTIKDCYGSVHESHADNEEQRKRKDNEKSSNLVHLLSLLIYHDKKDIMDFPVFNELSNSHGKGSGFLLLAWEAWGRKQYYMKFVTLYLTMIISFLFSTLALLYGPSCDYSTSIDGWRLFAELVYAGTVIVAANREMHEYLERKQQKRAATYFMSFYNITDLSIIVCSILMLLIRIWTLSNGCFDLPRSNGDRFASKFDIAHLPIEYRVERVLVSIMGALLLCEMLEVIGVVSQNIGIMILCASSVMIHIIRWAVVAVLYCMIFTIAIYVLCNYGFEIDGSTIGSGQRAAGEYEDFARIGDLTALNHPWQLFETMLKVMMGEVANLHDELVETWQTRRFGTTEYVMATTFFWMTVILAAVLMVNLLIALLSTKYSEVQEQATVRFNLNLASMLVDTKPDGKLEDVLNAEHGYFKSDICRLVNGKMYMSRHILAMELRTWFEQHYADCEKRHNTLQVQTRFNKLDIDNKRLQRELWSTTEELRGRLVDINRNLRLETSDIRDTTRRTWRQISGEKEAEQATWRAYLPPCFVRELDEANVRPLYVQPQTADGDTFGYGDREAIARITTLLKGTRGGRIGVFGSVSYNPAFTKSNEYEEKGWKGVRDVVHKAAEALMENGQFTQLVLGGAWDGVQGTFNDLCETSGNMTIIHVLPKCPEAVNDIQDILWQRPPAVAEEDWRNALADSGNEEKKERYLKPLKWTNLEPRARRGKYHIIFAGDSWTQRNLIIAALTSQNVVCAGGPGTITEVSGARENGSGLIPLYRTGGATEGASFGNRSLVGIENLKSPTGVSKQHWETMLGKGGMATKSMPEDFKKDEWEQVCSKAKLGFEEYLENVRQVFLSLTPEDCDDISAGVEQQVEPVSSATLITGASTIEIKMEGVRSVQQAEEEDCSLRNFLEMNEATEFEDKFKQEGFYTVRDLQNGMCKQDLADMGFKSIRQRNRIFHALSNLKKSERPQLTTESVPVPATTGLDTRTRGRTSKWRSPPNSWPMTPEEQTEFLEYVKNERVKFLSGRGSKS